MRGIEETSGNSGLGGFQSCHIMPLRAERCANVSIDWHTVDTGPFRVRPLLIGGGR